jgi:TRAP-type C4-dicarboxylate transport system permease small subunit
VTRDQIRGHLIVIAVAILGTVFFGVSARVTGILLGAISLAFLILLWVFAYTWYRNNRMAISLMPDRQRNVMYASMAAVTIPAAVYSVVKFVDIDVSSYEAPLLLVFLIGLFGMFWAWQESKRYYL